MGRFVKPQVTRLFLVDVHKRAHAELVEKAKDKRNKVTTDMLDAAAGRVAAASADGDWIDVKKRLNTGEQQDLFAQMAPAMTAGEKVQLNSKVVMTAKVLAYLVGWSLTDDGAPVTMTPDMSDAERLAIINNLDPSSFREIKDAIDAHEESGDAEVDAAKKDQAGTASSVATS
jgi:hypothetical protein